MRGRTGHIARALQLGPAYAFWFVFFAVPFGVLVAYSFYSTGFLIVEPAFQLDAYRDALTDTLYLRVLRDTLLVALLVATIVVAIAYPFAYLVTFVFPMRRDMLLFLVLISLFSGYLVRIYAWRTILGAEGIVNSMLQSIGVIDDPLRFLIYSRLAVVLVLVNILLPFAVLPIYAAMQNVPRDVLDGARDLGAGRFTVFRTVTLPMTLAGAAAAFAFSFVLAAGDYVTPTLVGGGKGLMIGNVIADQFGASFNWPLGAALAIVTVIAVAAVFVAVAGAVRLVTR